MRLYTGFDLHSSNSYVAIIDDTGKRAFKKKLPNDPEQILSALALYKDAIIGIVIERVRSWHSQKSFASPDTNNTNLVFIMPINDTKWRGDDLSQMFDIELGNDTAGERMRSKPLDLGDDFCNKPLSRFGRAFTGVIGLQILKVLDRRRGERYPCLFSHGIT
jgi:hypothetical protein